MLKLALPLLAIWLAHLDIEMGMFTNGCGYLFSFTRMMIMLKLDYEGYELKR